MLRKMADRDVCHKSSRPDQFSIHCIRLDVISRQSIDSVRGNSCGRIKFLFHNRPDSGGGQQWLSSHGRFKGTGNGCSPVGVFGCTRIAFERCSGRMPCSALLASLVTVCAESLFNAGSAGSTSDLWCALRIVTVRRSMDSCRACRTPNPGNSQRRGPMSPGCQSLPAFRPHPLLQVPAVPRAKVAVAKCRHRRSLHAHCGRSQINRPGSRHSLGRFMFQLRQVHPAFASPGNFLSYELDLKVWFVISGTTRYRWFFAGQESKQKQ